MQRVPCCFIWSHITFSSQPILVRLLSLRLFWNNSYQGHQALVLLELTQHLHSEDSPWKPFALGFSKGFPGGSEVKVSACSAGDLGSIPGSGRSPGEGNGNPLQYSCLENPMEGGAWWAIVHGVTELDMTEWVHFHFHLSLSPVPTALTGFPLPHCLFLLRLPLLASPFLNSKCWCALGSISGFSRFPWSGAV